MKRLFVLLAFAASIIFAPASAIAAKSSTKTYKAPGKTATYTRRRSRKVTRRRAGVVAHISLSRQRMTVYKNGRAVHSWKVSTGRSGYRTPRGSWRVGRMHKRYFSRKYDNAPMPYAMFFKGGYAIHGTNAIKRLGRPASHGCVRLHPSNAAKLFSMVRRSGGIVRITN